ncbi:MAG TPA: LamG-like jellyroll fold domain-containing protein [Candidatus Acidoferrum sp.]|nr:LamG-like jellyroll fold domain-containing protein [Candidatus Acidoferrum sp.]
MKFSPLPPFFGSPFQVVLILVASLFIYAKAEAWQMKQAPLMTQWASLVNTNSPLPEYPRPQLVRSNWLNLNGIWQFQPGATNDPVPTGQTLSSQILVPYPMESAISGVMQYSEFSWYRQLFKVPSAWSGKQIILHLDAVNWRTTLYVNGQLAGVHAGGYDPFSYNITPYLNGGTNELILQVYSPEDNGGEPRGKQTLYPGGIMYTSSSGIWQPVWLEPVDASGVSDLRIIPDVDNSRLRLTVNTYATSGVTVVATVSSNGAAINTMTGNPQAELDIPVPNPNLWSPENPFLYGLQISVIHNGVTNDSVTSYFGMRKISLSVVNGVPKIFLNNQAYFGIGPLDQGFWPDGIYTAPTDAALEYDLQQEKALGFNLVRKHIKVERQRWYYWADKLGLLVWQDMPSCNSYTGNSSPPAVDPLQFMAELSALVTNHWNSPCIIMWDIFNEGQGEAGSGNGVGQTNTAYLVQLVKTMDPQRLVNQASGGSYFGAGDVLDYHSYPDPGDPFSATQAPVDGEFGGIAWHVNGHLWNPAQAGTGYLLASSLDNFASLYDGYIGEAINFKSPANGGLNAAIYTQITDVENECNGLMTYDRLVKPDPDKIYSSNLKAITGHNTVTPVVPTSQVVPQTWLWTTNTPASNWYATNFNATGWSTGLAGFGTIDPGVTPNTPWTTLGYIYLRRTFNPGLLTPQQINNLGFTVYHDEDVAIYINGVFAGSASGYSSSYINLAMTPQAQAAIIPNGTNVLAVSCYQTAGGQFIDVGISDQQLIANTFTVATDEIGYWPLDATSGTVAVDATGNGYNGTVYGATWNPNGKVNGCLSFNGVNNYVQIPNPVSNDFSIVFWVKTTQATGGTGQWYNGTGLVDGDYPGGANDFGTALVGNKLAFGVGNPDATILSTSPINDGNWHQCVATRVQSTGVISLYVDGNLQATGTGNANSLNASASLAFGQIESGGGYFNGSLDEIEIFNRALGNNEVNALYNNGAFPQTTPTILLPPASQTLFASGTASFSAQAIGGNLNYQWYFGSAPILSATNNTLILTNVNLSNAGSYSIVVSNAAGSVTNSVTLTVLTPTTSLLHRYSFVSDASDSVGGANGTIVAPNGGGTATINHGLILPGSTTPAFGYSGYVSLPGGLLTATTNLTVECWVKQNQGNTWAEIWDFGNNGSQNFGLIPYPSNNGNNMEVAFTPNGGEQDLQSAVSFPNGPEQYVCVTYNASSLAGNLYTNGTLVASLTLPNITYTPGTIGGTGGTTENMLGNDVYGDDQFSGTIYEFRIWNGVVSPLYLAVSAAAGPGVVATNLTPLSLTVTVTNSSMGIGFTQQASVTGAFAAASGVPVTGFVTNWSSSNPSVLTVNGSGLITTVNTGSTTVSAVLNGVIGTSASITVTSSPPVITQEPVAAETVLAGTTLNTSVANVGNPPFTYRWYFNSGVNPVSTAETPVLTIPSLQPGNAGSYTCLVSNQYGTALSSALSLTVISPTTYQQSLLSLNPIAYWPLNETSGTVAHDLVGNYNGTYHGGFALAQAGPTNSIFGSPSRSALFDGTSAYVDIPEGPFDITGSITTVAWVEVLTSPKFAGLFGHGDASWRMTVNSSGQPGASDGNATDATSSTSIKDVNWHMVAYTCTGIPGINNGLLYVDGVLVASDSVTSPPLGDNLDVWIGGSPDYGAARLLNAKIAHAAIFTEALTTTQVQDLYTGISAAPVNLVVTRSGLSVVLNWPAGILLQAPTLTGPWTTNSAAVSPYTVTAASGNQFFKLLVNP